MSRDSIVVSTSRCGRENPGSNPGHGRAEPFMAIQLSFFLLGFSVLLGTRGAVDATRDLE